MTEILLYHDPYSIINMFKYIIKLKVTFKSTDMANLFVAGLKESGFARAMGSSQLADDSYYQKGADVWFLWSTKYHECFVGYGDVVEE